MPTVTSKPERAVTIDGKKFLWDGQLFATQEEASRQTDAYRNDNFEVELVEEAGRYRVYTRRVVKEVLVTAPQ